MSHLFHSLGSYEKRFLLKNYMLQGETIAALHYQEHNPQSVKIILLYFYLHYFFISSITFTIKSSLHNE